MVIMKLKNWEWVDLYVDSNNSAPAVGNIKSVKAAPKIIASATENASVAV